MLLLFLDLDWKLLLISSLLAVQEERNIPDEFAHGVNGGEELEQEGGDELECEGGEQLDSVGLKELQTDKSLPCPSRKAPVVVAAGDNLSSVFDESLSVDSSFNGFSIGIGWL